MTKRAAWRLGASLVAAAVLSLCLRHILATFRWSEALQIVRHANLLWLLGVGSASIVAYWILRSLRWFTILRNLGIRVHFGELYVCCAASLGIATVTPFPAGAVLIRCYGLLVVLLGLVHLGVWLATRPVFVPSGGERNRND